MYIFQKQLRYAVVSFIDEDSEDEITSEVPEYWLTKDKKQCWWPKTKDVRRLIAKSVKPSVKDKNWSLYNVNFQGLYGKIY